MIPDRNLGWRAARLWLAVAFVATFATAIAMAAEERRRKRRG